MALRDRSRADDWIGTAAVLCGGDPSALASKHSRSPAESAALLRAANLTGSISLARRVAEGDADLPGHLRGWTSESSTPFTATRRDIVAWFTARNRIAAVAQAARTAADLTKGL
ncbi:MAG: hypothetical protein RLZZ127_2728, partial [Planctomycetota bacterium]